MVLKRVVTPQNHCVLESERNPVHFNMGQPAACTFVQAFDTFDFIHLCEFSGIVPDM